MFCRGPGQWPGQWPRKLTIARRVEALLVHSVRLVENPPLPHPSNHQKLLSPVIRADCPERTRVSNSSGKSTPTQLPGEETIEFILEDVTQQGPGMARLVKRLWHEPGVLSLAPLPAQNNRGTGARSDGMVRVELGCVLTSQTTQIKSVSFRPMGNPVLQTNEQEGGRVTGKDTNIDLSPSPVQAHEHTHILTSLADQ